MKKNVTILSLCIFLGIVFQVMSFNITNATGTVPVLGNDNGTGKVFEDNGSKYVLWGVDADTWGCEAGNTALFEQHCQSVVYVNGNTIAIPITWKSVEGIKDVYNFSSMDSYITIANNYGLKATILWVGIDYAAGDFSFVPDYIRYTPSTYQRIVGAPFTIDTPVLCPSDPDTLAREKTAYYKMMEHLKLNNTSNTVLAVNCGGESDFMRALPESLWNQMPELDIRCECSTCSSLYANQGNLIFMEQQFAIYAKAMIDHGKTIYDIPVYTQVCAHDFYPGWRYAEKAPVIKSTVNRQDHFIVPSVANTSSVAAYVSEMNNFLPSNIPGNIIFTDGIDTAWDVNQTRIEIAPWFNTLWYGGMGALYWDSPFKSIRIDTQLREKLRKFWGPLKGIQDKIAKYKTSANKFWWYPDANTHTWGSTGNFAVDRVSSTDDYGVCFELGPQDICFTGSTYGGSFTFKTARAGGYEGYRFEKGSFDAKTGVWIKTGDVFPLIEGENTTLTVNSDSGDYTSAVYRYYYVPTVNYILEYKVAFSSSLSGAGNPLVDFRSINGGNAFSNITVNTGDKLSYEIYIPSYGNYKYGMGAVDGQISPSWNFFRANNPVDQYGLNLYSNLLETFDTDVWIKREIPITATNQTIYHFGPSMQVFSQYYGDLAGKTVKMYYRNIKIIHANNSTENIYVNGGLTSNAQMESTINDAFGTVTMANVVNPEMTFGNLKVNRSNILTRVGTGKRVTDIKAQIIGASNYLFKSALGTILADGGKVGTGTTVDLVANGITNRYTLLVYGDATGDGDISIDDLAAIKNNILKIQTLQGLNLKACDFDDDDKVNISSLITLKKTLVGLYTIPQ